MSASVERLKAAYADPPEHMIDQAYGASECAAYIRALQSTPHQEDEG